MTRQFLKLEVGKWGKGFAFLLLMVLVGWLLWASSRHPQENRANSPVNSSLVQSKDTTEESVLKLIQDPELDSPLDPGESGQAEVPKPTERIRLVGTAVASDPKWSSATLVDQKTREIRVYRIGDRIGENSRLVGIYSDRVIISEAEQRIPIYIQKETDREAQKPSSEYSEAGSLREAYSKLMEMKLPEGKTAQEGLSASGAKETPVEKHGENTFEVDPLLFEQMFSNPEGLIKNQQIRLAFDLGGHMEGIRLLLVQPGSVFEQVGFLNGDVIHRIGSVMLTQPENLIDIVKRFQPGTEVEVELTRQGRTVLLRYRLRE